MVVRKSSERAYHVQFTFPSLPLSLSPSRRRPAGAAPAAALCSLSHARSQAAIRSLSPARSWTRGRERSPRDARKHAGRAGTDARACCSTCGRRLLPGATTARTASTASARRARPPGTRRAPPRARRRRCITRARAAASTVWSAAATRECRSARAQPSPPRGGGECGEVQSCGPRGAVLAGALGIRPPWWCFPPRWLRARDGPGRRLQMPAGAPCVNESHSPGGLPH